MAITGKTGADAIFIALHHILRLVIKYQVKLVALIAQLEADSTITSAQAQSATTFINGVSLIAQVFEIIAANSNVD